MIKIGIWDLNGFNNFVMDFEVKALALIISLGLSMINFC